jgi:hypothetical protein
MGAHYRERISDERLQRVVEFVRAWVFAEADTGPVKSMVPQNTENCEIANAPVTAAKIQPARAVNSQFRKIRNLAQPHRAWTKGVAHGFEWSASSPLKKS